MVNSLFPTQPTTTQILSLETPETGARQALLHMAANVYAWINCTHTGRHAAHLHAPHPLP